MKDFKKLMVWQKSMDLFVAIHQLSQKLPKEERFELVSQLRRVAFSIPANIAEGSAESTNAHYRLFPENSLGSIFETETILLAIKRIYVSLGDKTEPLQERIAEIKKMLYSFIGKLK